MSPLVERGRRWLIPLLALLILVGGFVGVALSGGGSKESSARSGHERVRWLEHLADELGVSEEELLAAAERATESTLDDLVAQRLLTDQQADIIRARMRRALQNPEAIRGILRSLRAEAAPYRALLREVKSDVAEALAGELRINRTRLDALARRGELKEALERAGVSRAELKALVRGAATPALRDAVADGLITRRQARIALRKVGAFLEHQR